MMRNDYRRALILLKGNAQGYSGHVRLERRTTMGSMYFLLQAPAQCHTLRAALVGSGRRGYFACALGEALRDERGQAALSYSFDPRNICGHELEHYRLIVISCAGGQDCEIVLSGNVCGHADLNWDQVRMALCELYSGEGGENLQEAQLPAAGEIPGLPEEKTEEPAEMHAPQQEIREESIEKASEADATLDERPRMAGEMLDIDMDAPWPQSIDALRPLFALSVPMENPPDEEYIYIAAAMPPESGYAYCAVGIQAQAGMPVSVRYGLPSVWTDRPPAGLEEHTWVGNQNHGWWMYQLNL